MHGKMYVQFVFGIGSWFLLPCYNVRYANMQTRKGDVFVQCRMFGYTWNDNLCGFVFYFCMNVCKGQQA